jgi:hypothetical protein
MYQDSEVIASAQDSRFYVSAVIWVFSSRFKEDKRLLRYLL